MRKLGWVVGLIGLLLFSMSCDNPTESRSNPYEQHPIDWPSLAQSPWPIWRGNPMGNGQAFVKGPSKGEIKWRYTPDFITGRSLGLVIDSLHNVYTILRPRYLISLSSSGILRWKLELQSSNTNWDQPTPIVIRENKIVACVDNNFYIVSNDGVIEKNIVLPEAITGSGFQIDKRGCFYAKFVDGKLRKFDSDGHIYWETISNYGGFSSAHVPIFLPDGQAFIISNAVSIQKINIADGVMIWEYPTKFASTVAVDAHGLIYFSDDLDTNFSIGCLNTSGECIWKHSSKDMSPLSHHSILPDGSVVFSTKLLLAISPQGVELWQISLQPSYYYISSDLVSDVKGNVFGVTDFEYNLYSFSSNGFQNWKVNIGAFSLCSPAIDNGVIYLSNTDGEIYAIE